MKRSAILLHWICFSGVLCSLVLLVVATGCGVSRLEERRGEMVTFSHTYPIRGFDPVKAGDVYSAIGIGRMYEGLVQYSYLARPYKLEPALAESLPEISSNGLVYTFKIRKGIFFQDDKCFTNSAGQGRELVADDFVYSIKRLADPRNESTGYWAFNDRIVGLDEFREASGKAKFTDYNTTIEGLKALDRYTLQITLTRPYPQLLWILTMQYAFAVPREAVECYGEDFVNHPVGTGPFILSSWRRNYAVEYVRNPKWKETGRKEYYPAEGEATDREKGLLDGAGMEIPFLDRIVQYVIEDESTRWLKFVLGDLDLSADITRDNWAAVINNSGGLTEALSRKGVALFSIPELDIRYAGFNMDDPLVGKNKKLRQALTCAFNSEDWVRYFNGRVMRAKGPLPPGIAGYDDRPTPYPFDLVKAKKLLAEAGYPDGIDPSTGKSLQITLETGNTDPQSREATELLIDFVRKIGIVLNPGYNSWPTFCAKIERRQCQMFWLAWVADYPDAENFLQLFYGPNSSPNPNHCNYVNPEFDRLYEQVRVMPDCPERTGIYKRMADMVIEDCPWIYMHHTMAYGLTHSWLKSYKPHDFPYGMTKYIRVDPEKRRNWKSTYGMRNWRD